MVSTRQKATSGGSSNPNHNHGNGNNNAAVALESARLSVVTRQTSSNYVLVNCSTIPPTQQRPLAQTSSGDSSSILATTAAAATTRQQHNQLQTQHVNANAPQLLDMPIEIFAKICGYVGYRNVGNLRVISQKTNSLCMEVLNSTFTRLINQTYQRFYAIKANMPRRESARRNHPLACECDIIETCYMRLSLLQMTFGKHIERGHCCFFPGAILDEVYNILFYVRNTPRLERPYRVTDELFDLSTMAMEYFKDRIEPTLPGIAYFNNDCFKLPTNIKRPALVTSADHADSSSNMPSPPQSNMVLRKGIRKIKQGMKMYNNQLSVLRSELRTCKRKSAEQGKQMAEQQKLLAEQQKQTLEYANRLDENDKKNEEMSRKFSTLLQELNKCKTELQYWRSKSPAIPTCTTCGQKVVPVLPPEDYQALINQGVKPEDIILNLNDDTDAESDVSINDMTLREFAFPDQDTTAKLLAVSSASKNHLKRTHTATSNMNTSNSSNFNCNNNSGNSSSSGSSSGNGRACATGNCKCTVDVTTMANSNSNSAIGNKPSEMTNRLHYARGSNIIRTTANTASGSGNGMGVNYTSLLLPNKALGAMASTLSGGNCHHVEQGESAESGNSNEQAAASTKGYFGGGKSHKSVIVSPAMQWANRRQPQQELARDQADENVKLEGGQVNEGGDGVADAAVIAEVEDVASLQAITSHETKKARRVQKATRCLNGSGKRSK